jgi:hypothetical protein
LSLLLLNSGNKLPPGDHRFLVGVRNIQIIEAFLPHQLTIHIVNFRLCLTEIRVEVRGEVNKCLTPGRTFDLKLSVFFYLNMFVPAGGGNWQCL